MRKINYFKLNINELLLEKNEGVSEAFCSKLYGINLNFIMLMCARYKSIGTGNEMKKILMKCCLIFMSLNCYADNICEKTGSQGLDESDSAIQAEFKSSYKPNVYHSAYLICRSRKPIPHGSTITFLFNNGQHTAILDHKRLSVTTPMLRLFNDNEWDYFTYTVNISQTIPNKYSYECEYYLCKRP